MSTFATPQAVETAYSYALITLESATDHLAAYDAMVLMDAFSMAPLTLLRGLLEAVAVASWQLDPLVNARERVARNLALRFASLTMQRKVADSCDDKAGSRRVTAKLDRLEKKAVGLGYPQFRDKKGRRDTVGCRRPTMTDLLESELDFGGAYRPLSALAHGDAIALMQIGFSGVERVGDVAFVRKSVPTQFLRDFLASATLLYARPVWYHVVQFGRDRESACQLLETAANDLSIADSSEVRFWRGQSS
jgi:hypothetical protein